MLGLSDYPKNGIKLTNLLGGKHGVQSGDDKFFVKSKIYLKYLEY